MRLRGRGANQVFDPTEVLFLRFPPSGAADLKENDQVFVQIRVGDQSVNRSDPDGEAGDVLLWEHPKYRDWGVLAFQVGEIKSPMRRESAEDIHFKPVHFPEDFNFYHSVIQAFREDDTTSPLGKNQIRTSTKAWFRAEMSNVLTAQKIIIHPKGSASDKVSEE
jgi:hypothetical protein